MRRTWLACHIFLKIEAPTHDEKALGNISYFFEQSASCFSFAVKVNTEQVADRWKIKDAPPKFFISRGGFNAPEEITRSQLRALPKSVAEVQDRTTPAGLTPRGQTVMRDEVGGGGPRLLRRGGLGKSGEAVRNRVWTHTTVEVHRFFFRELLT